MKKIYVLLIALLPFLTLDAQRIAVLEFKANVGVSSSDVDGISAIFTTYFHPVGYTLVERNQIDKVIEEQGFQRSKITQNQMVRIGEILNVSKIVVGDVNIVMGQYNVDVRVINVQTGSVVATEGTTFAKGASYRATMQSLAQKLATKIASKSGTSQGGSYGSNRQRDKVEVVYGYLKVFPKELGNFDSEPKAVIAQINKQRQHGYNDWRIPTNEELSLLRANNYLGGGTYMTRENGRGIVLLVTDSKDRQALLKEGYVDLGLPSGTLWKNRDERGNYDNYSEVVKKYGKNLPTKQQAEELINNCKWKMIGTGLFTATGPNGNEITFDARSRSGYNDAWWGYFPTSTLDNKYNGGVAWFLELHSSTRYPVSKQVISHDVKYMDMQVRLVH